MSPLACSCAIAATDARQLNGFPSEPWWRQSLVFFPLVFGRKIKSTWRRVAVFWDLFFTNVSQYSYCLPQASLWSLFLILLSSGTKLLYLKKKKPPLISSSLQPNATYFPLKETQPVTIHTVLRTAQESEAPAGRLSAIPNLKEPSVKRQLKLPV